MIEPDRQRTIASEIEFSGIGLHSGADCRIRLIPAHAGGIVFHSLEARANGHIAASPDHVVSADHGTSLSNGSGARVGTIEHLMAALALVRVDHVKIEVDGPEVPIFDGSAAEFVAKIAEAGLKSLSARREPYVVHEKLRIGDDARWIEFSPYPGRIIELEIDFSDCLIGRQRIEVNLDDPETLVRLSTARTFVRLKEVEALKNAGLIRGGTLSNAIVVDGDTLLNEDPLREKEEFVLHKALDLLGDLYLLGAPIIGRVSAMRPGHELNTRAALALRKADRIRTEARLQSAPGAAMSASA